MVLFFYILHRHYEECHAIEWREALISSSLCIGYVRSGQREKRDC